MEVKERLKIFVDVSMTILFIILMAYHITGNMLHEWLGTVLFIFFIIHTILNYKWYKVIWRGKYTLFRILSTIINICLLFSMIGMIVSGIMLSREVFVFLHLSAGNLGRRLHMISTSWGFLLMSLHIGLHWNIFLNRIDKQFLNNRRKLKVIFCMLSWGLILFGFYSFIKRQIWNDLFLLIEFKFFDFEESAVFFFISYIAIMILFIGLAYYISKLIKYNLKKLKDM